MLAGHLLYLLVSRSWDILMCPLSSRDMSHSWRESQPVWECPAWQALRTFFGSSVGINSRGDHAALRGASFCTSLQSLCILQTAQTCLARSCHHQHREGAACSCPTSLALPERLRGENRKWKSGLRNCILAPQLLGGHSQVCQQLTYLG